MNTFITDQHKSPLLPAHKVFNSFQEKENCSISINARIGCYQLTFLVTASTWEHQQGRCYYAHIAALYINSAIHLIFLQHIPLTHMRVDQKRLNLLSPSFSYKNQCIKESLGLDYMGSL